MVDFAKKSFLGFFPRDKLPRITTYPSSLIVNTDKHNQKGEHWLAIYIGKNINCEFFDSFGFSVKEFRELQNRIKDKFECMRILVYLFCLI